MKLIGEVLIDKKVIDEKGIHVKTDLKVLKSDKENCTDCKAVFTQEFENLNAQIDSSKLKQLGIPIKDLSQVTVLNNLSGTQSKKVIDTSAVKINITEMALRMSR